MRVKICGITRLEDALFAERAGADALGLNFARDSKRRVTLEQARAISEKLGPFVARVGVFLDQPLEEVQALARALQLNAVQLHGQEDAVFAQALRPEFKVIKAVTFSPELGPGDLNHFPADAILLDGLKPGSGETFDWSQANAFKDFPRLILAGGLNPQNVGAGIRALGPCAVDVASGVETEPGSKDPKKVLDFIQQAKMALVNCQGIVNEEERVKSEKSGGRKIGPTASPRR
jgi:phosphoribosylanthranilate isomerase